MTSIPPQVFDLEHLEQLNLSGNALTVVPPEIERLRNLRVLDLGYNSLKVIPKELGRLAQLTSLILHGDPLFSFPDTLGKLHNLQELSLSTDASHPAQLPNWLSKLPSINRLRLSSFRLDVLPNWMADWKQLRLLGLSRNGLRELPEWLGDLGNLEVLWVFHNELTGVPDSLQRLQRLSFLGLPANRLSRFPTSILSLSGLQNLDLSQNQLSTLPESIKSLQALSELNLSLNQLIAIPETIGDLGNLASLFLWGNRLTTLPDGLYRLLQLRRLDLDAGGPKEGNAIRTISPKILQLDKLQVLSLTGNPLEIPPPEIAEKGIKAIREYFRQLGAEGTDYLYEAKLLIIGEGGAGKTTLAKKIQDSGYQLREEDSTRGIDVCRWQFRLDNGRTFQVNIWDFGGQEIYHATHQFFLTKRSLYALVADMRKEDTDFYYWLNVSALLSDGSPILIIKNEKQDRHREIDERALRGQFANLKETLSTNLATGRGLPKLVEEIRHQITHLPHVGTPLPKTWIRVREALEQEPRNYISLDEYLSICEQQGFADMKARLQLSEYLHDLGVCLHFQDDPLLRKTVILKPKWGTDAVYKVLDNPRVIRNLGRFTRDDLQHIWDEPEHVAMQDELLQLMMRFKLCYPIPGMRNTYLAPQLLAANQPNYPWQHTGSLLLRYAYEFMPKGILTQLIVAMHALIAKQQLVWKTGVVLAKDQTLAEILEHYDRREIRIRVTGKHQKELLVIAAHELDKIHASYPALKYSKLVPCNCAVCKGVPEPHFYRLEVLRQFVEDSQVHIQCQRSYQMVDVLGLVDDVAGRKQLLAVKTPAESEPIAREPRAQFLFGDVEHVVIHQALRAEADPAAESRGDAVTRPFKDTVRARSAWANGSFYLFAFVVVVAALGVLARTLPVYVLPVVFIAGLLAVPLIGALQLRNDERLAQKPFLELMKLVVGQLPLIRRISKQQND